MHHEKGDYEKEIGIFRKILRNYCKSRVIPVFHSSRWQLFISNYATALAVDGKITSAYRVTKKRIEYSLERGILYDVGRALSLICFVYEKQGGKNYEKTCYAALDMLGLIRHIRRYNIQKNYMEEQGIIKNFHEKS